MPFGDFLNDLPKWLLSAVHGGMLLIGLWAFWRLNAAKQKWAPALLLYVLSQGVFIAFFAGAFVVRMAILLEQILVVVMVVWIAFKAGSSAK